MTKHPIIGLTTFHRHAVGNTEGNLFPLLATYVDAVQMAGGIPILLPPNRLNPKRILDTIDGLILVGGGDINPKLYGGSSHPMVYFVNDERDEFELSLAKLALTASIPVLGICRGMQMLNIATGGDLIIHVPDVYGTATMHRLDQPIGPIEHQVEIEPNSLLEKIMQTTATTVISCHHQAVKNVPSSWRIVASAPDGLVEAIEYKSHPWMLGVQWHPEILSEDSLNPRIFEALVQAASLMALS
jgi:putative glutamine amidotransferase